MSTTTALMRSRAGAMTQFAETFAGGLAATLAYLSKQAESRRVYRELSGLSDRDLADIGISRSDVPRIAGLPSIAARQ
jgi:uncharacterized protein YjiS (DUF1127 family)